MKTNLQIRNSQTSQDSQTETHINHNIEQLKAKNYLEFL